MSCGTLLRTRVRFSPPPSAGRNSQPPQKGQELPGQLAGNEKLSRTCWNAASAVPPGASSISKVLPWRSKTTITAPLAGPESTTTILSALMPATVVAVTVLPLARLTSAWSLGPANTRISIGGVNVPDAGTCVGTVEGAPRATTLSAPPDPGSGV